MEFGQILNPPTYYSNRQDSIREIKFTQVKQSIESDLLTIIGFTKYESKIQFIKSDISKIDIKTEILVDCTCPSFKFEFAFANKKWLIFPEKYILTLPPKEKNPYRLMGVCKHLYALGRYIFVNKNKILERFEREVL